MKPRPILLLLLILAALSACRRGQAPDPHAASPPSTGTTPAAVATVVTAPVTTAPPTATTAPDPKAARTPTPTVQEQVEALERKAYVLAVLTDWQGALEANLAILALDPENARAYHSGGLSLHRLEEPKTAVTFFDQALALEASHADWYTDRSAALRDCGEVEKALADLDQAIHLDPELAHAFHSRASIHWELGDLTQALADLDCMLELEPTSKAGHLHRGLLRWELGNLTGAYSDFRRLTRLCQAIPYTVVSNAVQHGRSDDACDIALFYLADVSYALGRLKDALISLEAGVTDNTMLAFEYFDGRVRADPGDSFALFGRGMARSYLGDRDRALEDYSQAIASSDTEPLRACLFMARGLLYAEAGDLEAAIDDWLQALQVTPENVGIYYNLALAYEDLGDYEKAVLALQTAVTHDIAPRYRSAYANRLLYDSEWLLILSESAEQTAVALLSYELVASEIPEYTVLAVQWNNLCWYGALAGAAAAVLDACEQAVAMEPEDGSYCDSRGLARALTGDTAGAAADFRFFVQWAKENDVPKSAIAQRSDWITALESGANPFDAATLAAMRHR